jgi:hypothetical protein
MHSDSSEREESLGECNLSEARVYRGGLSIFSLSCLQTYTQGVGECNAHDPSVLFVDRSRPPRLSLSLLLSLPLSPSLSFSLSFSFSLLLSLLLLLSLSLSLALSLLRPDSVGGST